MLILIKRFLSRAAKQNKHVYGAQAKLTGLISLESFKSEEDKEHIEKLIHNLHEHETEKIRCYRSPAGTMAKLNQIGILFVSQVMTSLL